MSGGGEVALGVLASPPELGLARSAASRRSRPLRRLVDCQFRPRLNDRLVPQDDFFSVQVMLTIDESLNPARA
jgi:hypothetical protein